MGNLNKPLPIIVVSAINIFEGGPLTILNECLNSLNSIFYKNYQIIALVHRTDFISRSQS